MKIFLPLLIAVFLSPVARAQVSAKDSVLIRDFWKNFTTAVQEKNKEKMAALCHFPFSCVPCMDDSTLPRVNDYYVRITQNLFNKSQYRIFFEAPMITTLNKYLSMGDSALPYADIQDGVHTGDFFFLYTIVPPSASWEGSQGQVSIKKERGRYKIHGIGTIP